MMDVDESNQVMTGQGNTMEEKNLLWEASRSKESLEKTIGQNMEKKGTTLTRTWKRRARGAVIKEGDSTKNGKIISTASTRMSKRRFSLVERRGGEIVSGKKVRVEIT
jgi:hypothetical protein